MPHFRLTRSAGKGRKRPRSCAVAAAPLRAAREGALPSAVVPFLFESQCPRCSLRSHSSDATPEARAAGLWESHGPGGGITGAIAVDPSNPSTLYVGTTTRLFKSIDAGASWHAASTGLPVDAPRAVVVDPSDANVVYVAMEASGVFKSTNGGLSWSAASTGLPARPPRPRGRSSSIPRRLTTLYVADNAVGQVYKSTDGAASWNPATQRPSPR
mgnify:CR=1 FL=1